MNSSAELEVFCMYVLLSDVLILKVKYVLVLFMPCGNLALLEKNFLKTLFYIP